MTDEVRGKLDALLSRLEERGERGLATLRIEGRLVAREDGAVHLAVPSGVIAIPVEDIEDVEQLLEQREEFVALTVRNSDRVRSVIGMTPIPGGDPQGPWPNPWLSSPWADFFRRFPFGKFGGSVAETTPIRTAETYETYTISPGGGGACDDGGVIYVDDGDWA